MYLHTYMCYTAYSHAYTHTHTHTHTYSYIGIAVTCTELALDAAATMLEHKIRYHDTDAWSCWNCLLNCIKTSCSIFNEKGPHIERQLIKRCLSLVFQRLARSNDQWNMGKNSIVVYSI